IILSGLLVCGVLAVAGIIGGIALMPSTSQRVEQDTNAPSISLSEVVAETAANNAQNQEQESEGSGNFARADSDSTAPTSEPETNTADTAEPAPAQTDEPSGTPLPDNLTAEDLALFFEAWDNIEADFDGDMPSVEELNYALINAALGTLDDDYTRFLTPEMSAREREAMEGSFEGIGAFVRENDDGFIEIVRPIDGQPADLVGLRAGDLIIGVDGEDVIGQGIDEVISKVRGPRDTQVILTIGREGEPEPLEFTITRALVEIPVLETRMLDNNIAYLHLTTFASFGVDREVETAVR
ncbi:MAG: PDZ domain-containing protein, partial [Anaerolineales bacterium]|nr:PDZ domain-containing protein [Anaerolineales bacterium]